MRRLSLAALAVLLVAALTAACGGDGGDDRAGTEPAGRLPTREVKAGEVTVKVTPVRIDGAGAEFTVDFDTHAVDLGFDPAATSRLTVAGRALAGAAWQGDGPGGHHRAGTLRFTGPAGGDGPGGAGAAGGEAVLTLAGLDPPAVARWTLPDAG